MEADFCPLSTVEVKPSFDFELTSPNLDLGYYSSLSPTSSVDSCCFSPPVCQFKSSYDHSGTSQAWETPPAALPAPIRRRTRSKNPGKKRQSASEREKLRMRDLTKALHHLRSFLPPSVAPVGQTLTKIETLRLTIRYISYLSSQLGLEENVQSCSQSTALSLQQRLFSETWDQSLAQRNLQYSVQDSTHPSTTLISAQSSVSRMYYRNTELPQFLSDMSRTSAPL